VSVCSACSGSGYYDADGSPPCGSCGGTGDTEPDWSAIAEQLAAALERQGCDHCDGVCRDCSDARTAALALYEKGRGT
jgi:DnaJ-class molecular chaperone